MFREFVNNPIDPIPEQYVDSLKRVACEPDYSLTCMCIAMLKSRIDNYGGIDGVYYYYGGKQECVTDFEERIKTADTYPLFCYYKYSKNDAEDVSFPEFKEKKSIAAFVKEKMGYECQVFYHEKKNITGIFVSSNDMRLYHLLLSFISLYFPSLFVDHPLTEDDYALIKSLSKKDRGDFYSCIKKLVDPYTVEFRRIQLARFMKGVHEAKINTALMNVNNARRAVSNAESQLNQQIVMLKDMIVTYEGLKATEQYDKPEEDLVESISTCPNIHNLQFDERNHIMFSVATYLNNYNLDAWETFSRRGNIYDGDYNIALPDVFKIRENRKLLLDSIFADKPEFMIRLAGNYSLNLADSTVSSRSDYDYEEADPIYKDYLPNPHIAIFACLGGYKDAVKKALMDRNYVAAFELCVTSAGSINLDEVTQTFRPFIGWLFNSKKKCLVTRDNKEFTPEEALVWLIDKEKKDEAD